MEKQLQNKGFTVLEMLISIMVLAILVLITIPSYKKSLNKNINFIINDIAFKQFEAILDGYKMYYEEYDTDISFNRIGNINHADTYYIEGNDIIVTLGTGRIYIDEE